MLYNYNYVEPCRRCGSFETGYYIYSNTDDANSLMYNALKKGELVRVRMGLRDSSLPSLFCDECGVEWNGQIIRKRLNNEELLQEFENRGINLNEILSPKELRKMAEEEKVLVEKKKKKKKLKKVMQFLTGFKKN